MPKNLYVIPARYGTVHLAGGKTATGGDIVELDDAYAADIRAERAPADAKPAAAVEPAAEPKKAPK